MSVGHPLRAPVAWCCALLVLFAGLAVARPTTASDAVGDDEDRVRVEEFAVRRIDIGAPGPLGPITVFGDSVLLGSALTSPTLPELLSQAGWGPVRFLAGAGFNTGTPEREPAIGRITANIRQWRAEGWDTEAWVVNLGANDSGFCTSRDSACMRTAIRSVMDELGPDARVWWPQMTIPFSRAVEQFTWNTALALEADARPNLTTWNWPGVMAGGDFPSGDNVHLSPSGYRARSVLMTDQITNRLAAGRPSGRAPQPLPTATADPSGLVTGVAARVADTRRSSAGRQQTGDVLRVDLADRVPEGTTAVALYVTAALPHVRGHLIAGPCGTRPDASTVNFEALDTRGAPTITRIGEDRSVCIHTVGLTHVVVDLQAAFHPSAEDRAFLDPLAVPDRVEDTRRTGRTRRLVVDAPAGAVAVAVNLTAVGATTRGHVNAAPCDATPIAARLNYRPGPAIASSAVVDVGDDGTFCITTNSSVDLVVDLTGVFRTDGALQFEPVTPTRVLNTRNGVGGWTAIHGIDDEVRVRSAPADAEAVTGTITIVRPTLGAHLTASSCAGAPRTSSVNGGADTVAANSLTVAVDEGHLCITTSGATHTLFDTTGWWVPR